MWATDLASEVHRIVGMNSSVRFITWAHGPHDKGRRLESMRTTDSEYLVWGWSPDSTRILFTSIGFQSYESQICVVNLDGSGLQRIDEGWNPCWSPDGKYIAFLRHNSPAGPEYEVWVTQIEP